MRDFVQLPRSRFLYLAVFIIAVAACFFGEYLLGAEGFGGDVIREFYEILHRTALQRLVVICCSVYLLYFLFLESHSVGVRFWSPANTQMWWSLILFIGIAARGASGPSGFTSDALTFLFSLTLSKGVRWFIERMKSLGEEADYGRIVLLLLVAIITVAVFWHPETTSFSYYYHGQRRWSGPWENPNTYGMLMSLCLVLVFAFVTRPFVPSWSRSQIWERLASLVPAIFFALSLLKSLSRGAWLGCCCGLAYYVVRRLPKRLTTIYCCHFRHKDYCLLFIIFTAVAVLFVWGIQQTDRVTVRRLGSMVETKDFSWRHRLAAWEGALLIMSDKPLLGVGWNNVEITYCQQYQTVKMKELTAFQLNDYLTFGAAAGIPLLLCFLSLVITKITGRNALKFETNFTKDEWRTIACRSGVVVFLIGFWFDGGLFKLPTAVPFWILFELSSLPLAASSRQVHEKD